MSKGKKQGLSAVSVYHSTYTFELYSLMLMHTMTKLQTLIKILRRKIETFVQICFRFTPQ